MNKVISAGGIVVRGKELLLIRLDSGKFAIPKGHVEPGETNKEAAIREVEEETAVKPEVIQLLGELERLSEENNSKKVRKTIVVYLMRKVGVSKLKPDENSEWVGINSALELMHFKEEQDFILKNLNLINHDY